jgi:hypothetical protein
MTLREAFEKLRRLHNASITYGSAEPTPTDMSFFYEAIASVYKEGARRNPPLTKVQIERVIENANARPEEIIVIKLGGSENLVGAKVFFGFKIRSNITLDNNHPGFLQAGDTIHAWGEKRYRVNTVTDKRISAIQN